MKLSQFRYNLPEELIAKYPAENRDESRLMVLNRSTRKIEHRIFKEIIDYFEEHDVMVFNNTKVFPARLYGNKEKTGAEKGIRKIGDCPQFFQFSRKLGTVPNFFNFL